MPATTLVRDVMTAGPVTVAPETSVDDAAKVLAEHRFGALPVVDATGRLVGMLRDDDLIVSEARLHIPTVFELFGGMFVLPGQKHRFEEELHKVGASTVAEVMDDEPPTVTPGDTIETVATIMHDRSVSHVAVVDAGRCVGILARGDLVRLLAAERGR
jgi:CBS domain-containing protein